MAKSRESEPHEDTKIGAVQHKEELQHDLDENEQWLRMLIDSAEDYAIFAVNLAGKIASWSKGAEKLFGYAENEIVGQEFSTIFTKEDREQGVPRQEIERAQREGYCPDVRWHKRKDGSRLFVSGAVRPLRDKNQHVHGFLKVAHDVTEQKQAEELQAQFRALFESAPGLFLVLTPKDYRIVGASDAFLRATMTERDGIMGRGLFEVFPDDPEDPNCTGKRNLEASLARVTKERRRDVMAVQYYPIPRPASQGGGFEPRWWSPINTPVLGPGGKVTHIIHRVEDMTPFVRQMQDKGRPANELQLPDLRLQQMAEEVVLRGQELQRANEEIRRSRAQLEAVFQAMQGGVIVSDPAGNLILVNEAEARMTGYSSADAMKASQKNFREMFEIEYPAGGLVPLEDWPLARVLRGEILNDWQLRARRRDNGREWFLRFSGQPVRDENGRLVLGVLVTRDITHTKQAETALRETRDELARANAELEKRVQERTVRLTETIQELEGFSYSMSHDMRAPLRAMQSFAEILRTDFGQRLGAEGVEFLNRIASAAARLDELIRDVLTLSRMRSNGLEMHLVDLENLLRQIIHERRAFQPPRAEVIIVSPLLKVLGHEALATQCLSNLLDNAVKFVAPGVHPQVRVWTEPRANRVRVWVEDNGIGVSKEYHERIFRMFERLHANERYPGTGIGLAIVRKAVERMGGQAGVESEPGKGSRFWLDLNGGENS